MLDEMKLASVKANAQKFQQKMALFKEMIKRTENIDKTDIDTQAIHRSLKLWSISPLSMNKTGWLED